MVQGEKCNNDDADKMNSRKWQATKTKIFELNTIKESKKKIENNNNGKIFI